MKKLITLLTLLVVAVTGAWADEDPTPDYESYDWNETTAKNDVVGTHGNITIYSEGLGSLGNVSGHWYIPVGQNLKNSDESWKYFGISSTRQITRIDILYCPNGSDATNIAWVAWGQNVEPNQYTLAHGETTGTKGSKSWDAKVWETIDLSNTEAYTVYISRSIREFREIGGTSNLSNFGKGKTFNILGFRVYLKAAGPTITAQTIADANYVINSEATALSVTATASAGDLSYQWYSNTVKSTTEGTPTEISGATNATYTPNTTSPGTTYYFCKVSDTNGFVYSDIAEIVVAAASAPTAVTVTPSATSVERGGEVITLTAEVTGGVPTPTLQWYSNTTASNESGTPIDGATKETYQPAIDAVGTFYYYVVATNASGSAKSAAQAIAVAPKAPTMTASGYFDGTKVVEIAKADGEAAAAEIKYSTDNGESWSDYTAELNITETTTVKAKVVQAGLESDVVSATYTKIILDAQTDVTSAKVWDWSKISGEGDGKELPDQIKNQDVVFSNIAKYGYTINDSKAFDQQALLVNCQFAWRDANGSKFLQGNKVQFNTTVDGTVTIEYANTGNNAARTVVVNGTKGTKSSTANNSYQSESFDVTVGSVEITGAQVSDDAAKMLRIRKVVFMPYTTTVTAEGWATATTPSYAVDFDENAEVYIATAAGESITLTKITEAPANTPIVVNAPAGSYTMTKKAEATTDVSENLLMSSDGSIVGTDTESPYVLGKNTSDVVGFGPLAKGVTLAAGKAYIPASSLANAVDFLPFVIGDEESETTSINSIENGELRIENSDYIYNLAGQKVSKDYKSIVVVNGKKFVRK